MRLQWCSALVLGTAAMLGAGQLAHAQRQIAPGGPPAAQAPEADPNNVTVDALGKLFSEDRANLTDYWPAMEKRTKETWLSLLPAEAQPPRSVGGTVRILCVVHTDGTISGMSFDQRSGKPALDRAAWAAVLRSAPYDAFPYGISTDRVKVGFTFTYNGGTTITPLMKPPPKKPGM